MGFLAYVTSALQKTRHWYRPHLLCSVSIVALLVALIGLAVTKVPATPHTLTAHYNLYATNRDLDPVPNRDKPMPNARAWFVGGGAPDGTVLNATIAQALQDSRNLKAWYLCAAELRAKAAAEYGFASAESNMHKPDMLLSDTVKAVTVHGNLAHMYEKAAAVAQAADVPCIDNNTQRMRYIGFDVRDPASGSTKTLVISDFYLLGKLVAEYHVQARDCAQSVRMERDDYEQSYPRDPIVLAEYAAAIQLLDELGDKVPCM